MIKYEDFCVGCTDLGLRCKGAACPYNKPIPVHYCDKCGAELDEIYEVDDEEICEECLKDLFRKN